jgi:hypothetical protein
MNLMTLLSLGTGVVIFAACAAWYFLRPSPTSAPDLGSISRNWIMEHRNDRE